MMEIPLLWLELFVIAMSVIVWATLFYTLPSYIASFAITKLWRVRDRLTDAQFTGAIPKSREMDKFIESLEWTIHNLRSFTVGTQLFDRWWSKRHDREMLSHEFCERLAQGMTEKENSFFREQIKIVQYALLLKIWGDSILGILSTVVLCPLWVLTWSFTRRPFWYERLLQKTTEKIEVPPLAFLLLK